MDIYDAFPSKFLKAADLGQKAVRVIIESVDIGKMQDGSSKPIVTFKGHVKQLVLNKTNAKKIEGYYGRKTEGWIGKEIILYSTEVEFQGEQIMAIRVKMPALPEGKERIPTARIAAPPEYDDLNPPPPTRTPLADALDDEIPF